MESRRVEGGERTLGCGAPRPTTADTPGPVVRRLAAAAARRLGRLPAFPGALPGAGLAAARARARAATVQPLSPSRARGCRRRPRLLCGRRPPSELPLCAPGCKWRPVAPAPPRALARVAAPGRTPAAPPPSARLSAGPAAPTPRPPAHPPAPAPVQPLTEGLWPLARSPARAAERFSVPGRGSTLFRSRGFAP